MAKRPKASAGGSAGPDIPWRIRVREDEEFRPESVSLGCDVLGVVLIGERVAEYPGRKAFSAKANVCGGMASQLG